MDTLWNILQAIGVGAAAGLSPLVALATVVVSVAIHLGIDPVNDDYGFLTSAAAVIVAVVVLLQSLALIALPGGMLTRVSADRPRLKVLLIGIAVVLGGLGGSIVFGAQSGAAWVGGLLGLAAAGLVAWSAGALLKGVAARIDRGVERQLKAADQSEAEEAKRDAETSRRILAFGVDVVTIVAVVLALLLPPVGLVLPIVAVALIFGSRRREAKKHEGLRVLS